MTVGRQRLGARGEQLAARHYEAAGFDIVARNWRCADGELDLVVRDRRRLVFAEVKTRSSSRFGHPAEAVTPAKQQRIRRLAQRFCAQTGAPPEIRFDVVAVLRGEVEVIEGCFERVAGAGHLRSRPPSLRGGTPCPSS